MEAIVNGVRIDFDDVGPREGPGFLLIHGFPLDRRMWQEQVAGLSDTVRLIVPDLRGHGRSAVPPGPYTMEQHADDLAGLLDHLGIRRAVVGGLSMGGYVAFALWRRHAARVAGMVLMDTRAEADSPAARDQRNARIATVRAEGVPPLAHDQLPAMLAASNLKNDALRQVALDIMLAQTTEGVVNALGALRDRVDNRDLLPAIDVPVLVIVGEEDRVTPPEVAAGIAESIPGAELLLVPRGGHLAPLENPGDVNRALAAFLDRVSSGG